VVYDVEIVVPGDRVNFTFNRDWLHVFEFWAVDNDGNIEDINERTIKVDNFPPYSWMTLEQLGDSFAYGCAGGVCEPGQISTGPSVIDSYSEFIIWAEDTGIFPVGAYTVHFRIEGPPGSKYYLFGSYFPADGTWHTGYTGIDVPVGLQIRDESGYIMDGKYMIEFYAADALGNTEPTIYTYWFLTDTHHPFTKIYFTGPSYTDGTTEWITTSTSVHLGGSDDVSGVKCIKYRIDDGVDNSYSGAFSINTPGEHTIYYNSIDWFNHIEPEKKMVVLVDDTSPTTELKLDGNTFSPTGPTWISSSTSIILDSKDTGCGLKSTYYRVNRGTWVPYQGPFHLDKGIFTVEFYAEDNLGNSEVCTAKTVGVDTQAPSITLTNPRTNHLYISGREILPLPRAGMVDAIILGQTQIDVTVNDTGCGVDTIKLYIDEKLYHKSHYTTSFSYLCNKRSVGIHTIHIEALDILGHISNEQVKVWILNI